MTKSEAIRILKDIDRASSKELDSSIDYIGKENGEAKGVLASVGAGIGALSGALAGGSPWTKVIGGALGGILGGGAGYGIGALSSLGDRNRIYKAVKKRRAARVEELLSKLDDKSAKEIQGNLDKTRSGIQTQGTDYGSFVSGKGTYSGDDRLNLKTDDDGRPVLSLLFAGINSSVENGGKAVAKSPFAARFYNKNRNKFSDVQANTVFDEPIIADAYIDKIVAKIIANRDRYGKYPRLRLVGYSAGGRGVVNFLKKMRERDPKFKADEIIGIDAYQRPWEDIPDELKDPENPVADKIVYSRPAEKYTGSSQEGLGRVSDVLSNTAVALAGKQLNGIAANKVIENYIPGIAHTDADRMYESAMQILSTLHRNKQKDKEKKT